MALEMEVERGMSMFRGTKVRSDGKKRLRVHDDIVPVLAHKVLQHCCGSRCHKTGDKQAEEAAQRSLQLGCFLLRALAPVKLKAASRKDAPFEREETGVRRAERLKPCSPFI